MNDNKTIVLMRRVGVRTEQVGLLGRASRLVLDGRCGDSEVLCAVSKDGSNARIVSVNRNGELIGQQQLADDELFFIVRRTPFNFDTSILAGNDSDGYEWYFKVGGILEIKRPEVFSAKFRGEDKPLDIKTFEARLGTIPSTVMHDKVTTEVLGVMSLEDKGIDERYADIRKSLEAWRVTNEAFITSAIDLALASFFGLKNVAKLEVSSFHAQSPTLEAEKDKEKANSPWEIQEREARGKRKIAIRRRNAVVAGFTFVAFACGGLLAWQAPEFRSPESFSPHERYERALKMENRFLFREANKATALEWYKSGASDGDADAQRVMGYICEDGELGMKVNQLAALEWFKKAAEQGDVESSRKVGAYYDEGLGGVAPDPDNAFAHYMYAATNGDDIAQCRVGEYLMWGGGNVMTNREKALIFLRQSAAQKNADALCDLYEILQNGPVKARAIEYLREAAELGHSGAQEMLAERCQSGDGVVPDPELALKWRRKAVEQDNPVAQRELARCYENGICGVKLNLAESARLYLMAAQQGDVEAQARCGDFRGDPEGGKYDLREAVKWYRLAAGQGNAYAQYRLGCIFREGDLQQGLPKDDKAAVKWMTDAADGGCVDAIFELALMYSEGSCGLEKNPVKAKELYERGAEAQHPGAINNLACLIGRTDDPQSEKRAFEYYRESAHLGNPIAAYNLASYYEQGHGGAKKDQKKAFACYMMAATNGCAEAQYMVGQYRQYGNGGVEKNEREAFVWYQKAETMGSADAMDALGDLYYDGRENIGIERDLKKAVAYYRKSAEGGSIFGAYDYGLALLNGEGGLERDVESAVTWLKKAADDGLDDARIELFNLYYHGADGVDPDEAKGLGYLRPAVANGNSTAQYVLGTCYLESTNEARVAEGRRLLKESARQGNAAAQCDLALMHYYGNGMSTNFVEAAQWWMKSARQGNALAQYNLAICYRNGEGVRRNNAEAMKWYICAAEQGDADFQFTLGCLYDEGELTERNSAEAVVWWTKAALQDHVVAQRELAECYATGRGVATNLVKAAELYRRAAEQGDAWAQGSYGDCYLHGLGVGRDVRWAIFWYRKAADQEIAAAQYCLGLIYSTGDSQSGVKPDGKEAVRWMTKAAEQEYPDAIYELALMYEEGKNGLVKNLSKAKELYSQGAKARDAKSLTALADLTCWYEGKEKRSQAYRLYEAASKLGDLAADCNIAQFYAVGDGPVGKDPEKAFQLYLKAATNGHARAQYVVGCCFQYGELGRSENMVEAYRWYREAAANGCAAALTAIGGIYFKGSSELGIPCDMKMAVKYFRQAAEKGDPEGACYYGSCYLCGMGGLERSPELAVHWITKGADASSPLAQYLLGCVLFYGEEGVRIDQKRGVKYLKMSIENGFADAEWTLGSIYMKGPQDFRDTSEGRKLLSASAEHGSPRGQYEYALLFYSGETVEKDYVKAVTWWRKAAEQGHVPSQYNLGVSYCNGLGVQRDMEEARRWWRKASEQGFDPAKKALLSHERSFGSRNQGSYDFKILKKIDIR